MNYRALDMICMMKSRNPRIKLSLITNGSLIRNERMIETICDSGLDNITFSLDGAERKTYESIRRGGKFGVLVENIRALNRTRKKKHVKLTLAINFVAMKQNVRELPELLKLASQLGVSLVSVSGLIPYQKAFCDQVLYQFSPRIDASYKFITDAMRLAKRLRVRLMLPRLSISNSRICDTKLSFVSYDGLVSPCENLICKRVFFVEGEKRSLNPLIMGDLKRQSFFEIYNSSAYAQFREDVRKREFPIVCDNCLMSRRVICP